MGGGGGGGGGYFGRDPRDVLKDLAAAQQKTQHAEYESHVADVLKSYLSEFNDRNVDAVSIHLEQIKAALEKEIEGTVDLRFGGSVSKNTYVEGISDIDSLVLLDNCELADQSPGDAKDYLAKRLRERFARTDVTVGHLAVTIHFSDSEIQLLPAVSCRDHVKIADANGTSWAAVRPKEFATVLTDVNKGLGGKAVPVVKLAKAIVAKLPEPQRIKGYHAESLAVEIFRDYQGSDLSHKGLLQHYFAEGARRVLEPIRDRSGQSVHVDDYLGETGSLKRRLVADAFGRVTRRMKNIDAAGRPEDWRGLFD